MTRGGWVDASKIGEPLTRFTEPESRNFFAQNISMSRNLQNPPFNSVGISDHPDWSVVLNSPGAAGVYSWHIHEHEAKANAEHIGGTVVPVDYIDGELITPSLAKRALSDRFGL